MISGNFVAELSPFLDLDGFFPVRPVTPPRELAFELASHSIARIQATGAAGLEAPTNSRALVIDRACDALADNAFKRNATATDMPLHTACAEFRSRLAREVAEALCRLRECARRRVRGSHPNEAPFGAACPATRAIRVGGLIDRALHRRSALDRDGASVSQGERERIRHGNCLSRAPGREQHPRGGRSAAQRTPCSPWQRQ